MHKFSLSKSQYSITYMHDLVLMVLSRLGVANINDFSYYNRSWFQFQKHVL